MVVGATNNVALIDPSVLRPGRFGVHLYVGLPQEDERRGILRIHVGATPLADGLTVEQLLDRLAPLTEGLSGADIAFVCQQAKFEALTDAGFENECRLNSGHFERALAGLNSAREWEQ
jgi:transitional endoplasmic reticulum ATPase